MFLKSVIVVLMLLWLTSLFIVSYLELVSPKSIYLAQFNLVSDDIASMEETNSLQLKVSQISRHLLGPNHLPRIN